MQICLLNRSKEIAKLNNKQKNHPKQRGTKRYEKLSMELWVQTLPGLEGNIYIRNQGQLLLMLEILQDKNNKDNR